MRFKSNNQYVSLWTSSSESSYILNTIQSIWIQKWYVNVIIKRLLYVMICVPFGELT